MLGDGTDIAKVAMVNGAARVAPDAPDAYRAEQLDALDNRRALAKRPRRRFACGDHGAARRSVLRLPGR